MRPKRIKDYADDIITTIADCPCNESLVPRVVKVLRAYGMLRYRAGKKAALKKQRKGVKP